MLLHWLAFGRCSLDSKITIIWLSWIKEGHVFDVGLFLTASHFGLLPLWQHGREMKIGILLICNLKQLPDLQAELDCLPGRLWEPLLLQFLCSVGGCFRCWAWRNLEVQAKNNKREIVMRNEDVPNEEAVYLSIPVCQTVGLVLVCPSHCP